MRHITGTVHGAALTELQADPGVGMHSDAGLTVVVIHHTNSRLSADTLHAQYRQHGVAGLERGGDDCTVVVIDQPGRTFVLARDFVGATPLYYTATDGAFTFGTRIIPVLEAAGLERAPDRRALASYLVDYEGPNPGTTWFEQVAAVPPGRIVVVSDGRITTRAAALPRPVPHPWSFADASAEFGRLLAAAVARRIPAGGKSAVFVSGGLDSSALLCLAANAGDVLGINYGTTDDVAADETRYLAALRAHGLPIEEVPFLPAIDAAAAEQSVREAEAPLVDMLPLTLARAAARSVMAGAETLLIGTWGDQVLSPFPPAHHRTLAPWRLGRLARAYQTYMADVPVPEIARTLRRQALRHHAPAWMLQRRRERRRRESIFDILAQSTAAFAPVQRTRTYHDAVMRNVFAPGVQQGIEMTMKWGSAHRVDARLPFLDRELVQFLLTIPDEIAYHEHALKPLLRASMKGTVPREVIERRDKGDYTTVMRRSALPAGVVMEMLDGLRRLVKHDIMSPAAARNTLARMEREPDIGSDADELSMILGLDIWLRLFFEK